MLVVQNMPIIKGLISNMQMRIQEITGQRFKIILQEYPTDDTQKMMEKVLEMVCEEFNMSAELMRSKKRYQKSGLMDARHTFFYICHKILGYSSVDVGRYLLKDHSTVLVACEKIEGYIFTKDPVSKKIEQLIKSIQYEN